MPTPNEHELLVRVHTASVSSGDARMRAMRVPWGMGLPGRVVMGLSGPRQPVLGTEFCGVVTRVGSRVSSFAPGQRVIGYFSARMGAHAQYVTIAQDAMVVPAPERLSDSECAAIAFGGLTALHFLRDRGRVRIGQRVLIHGASGAVGVAAVQIAKHLGARVTGSCSAGNAELVRSLGADEVVDYTRQDVLPPGAGYDVILDAAGTLKWSRCRRALTPRGVCLFVDGGLPTFGAMLTSSLRGGPRAIAGVCLGNRADLRTLMGLVEAGALRAVIDSEYPLSRIADAHRRVDQRRKRGCVVVHMNPEG